MHCKLLESHVFVNVNGRYQLCCESSDRHNKESIYTHSPIEWLNSAKVTEAKNLLSQGIWPSQCFVCKNQEALGLISSRQAHLHLGNNIELLDLRFSNRCNLKCISCTPLCSSSIAEEIEDMNKSNVSSYIPIKLNHSNWIDWNVLEQFTKIPAKKVKFAGGEPMLIRHLDKVLEKLDPATEIVFTSNLTILNPKIITALKRFRTVRIAASVDAIGKKIEYIRYGSDWKTIEYNIMKYREVAEMNIAACVSVLNILYYHELIEWAESNQLKVSANILEEPYWLNIKNAPQLIKDKVQHFLSASAPEASPLEQEIFKRKIKIIDNYRKKSIVDYLPEVAEAYGIK